jgi:hypothetical protein
VKDDEADPNDAPQLPGLEELLRRNLEGDLHRAQLEAGMVVAGKWELTRRLGAGGFGQVWEAWHIELEQTYAIKFLDGEHGDPAAVRARFLAEARLMAEMSSEHLVRVTDYGELPDEVPYFVMELVRGRTLRQRLHEPLSVPRAIEIAEELLQGLCEVHERGITHGDVKPENIILSGAEEKVRVLDFGLAQITALASGAAGGTPPYMAPEIVLDGAPASPRSDIYGVGVVLYEMLTGRLPRGHASMGLEQIRRSWERKAAATPVRLHRKDVPAALDELVMEALAKEPTARPKAARAMLEELRVIAGQMAEGLADTVGPEEVVARTDTEIKETRKLAVLEVRGWVAPVVWIGAVVLALVGLLVWWGWSGSGGGGAGTEGEPDGSARVTLAMEDLAPARDGVLVVAADEADGVVASTFEELCNAVRGGALVKQGLACKRISAAAMDPDELVARAEEAEVGVVVLVGEQVVVRSTSHARGSPLLARLEGLPLPADPSMARQVGPVLRAVVDPHGSGRVAIPALDPDVVGPRWAVLGELLRSQREPPSTADRARRRELKKVLSEEFLRRHDEPGETGFYRDLAALVWAGSVGCDSAIETQRELSTRGEHEPVIRMTAQLGLAACLVEGGAVALERAAEAEALIGQALKASDWNACIRLAALGTLSRIDLWRGDDALWNANREQLPKDDACEPAMWSRVLSVRGDALVAAERWCDAAQTYERAYVAMPTKPEPLLNWAEYDWLCKPDRSASREPLLQHLRDAPEAEQFQALQPRVSITYLLWWLTQDAVDAQRVLDAYRQVKEGEPALLREVADDLVVEICGPAGKAKCSHTLLAGPKQPGDEERLRGLLDLR